MGTGRLPCRLGQRVGVVRRSFGQAGADTTSLGCLADITVQLLLVSNAQSCGLQLWVEVVCLWSFAMVWSTHSACVDAVRPLHCVYQKLAGNGPQLSTVACLMAAWMTYILELFQRGNRLFERPGARAHTAGVLATPTQPAWQEGGVQKP